MALVPTAGYAQTMRCLLVMALLASSLAHAGMYMEHEAVLPNPADMTKSVKQTLHTWHDGKHFKRESPLRKETVIVDLHKGEVYGVNDGNQTYWQLPVAEYQQLALLSLVVMGVPLVPDGTPIVPDPMFAPTGQTAVIEGRKAIEARVTGPLPPGVSTTVWLSADIAISPAELVEQMRVSLGNPVGPAFERLFGQWASLKGYPVQNVTTIRTPQGLITTSETLLTYRDLPIPAREFAVPKGYALIADPISAIKKAAAAAQPSAPAGIGAPLVARPPSPVTGASR